MNAGLVSFAGPADPQQGAPGHGSGGMATGWRKELEKAFTRGWFHGPLEARSPGNPAVCAGQGRSPRDVTSVKWHLLSSMVPGADLLDTLPPNQAGHQSAQSPCPAAPSLMPARTSAAVVASAWTPNLPAMTTPAALDAEEVLPASVMQGGVPRASPAHEQPTRIHIERGEQGLAVWIGLDGEAACIGAQAQAIAADLVRQAQGAPWRLAAVICNGLVVYGTAPGTASTTKKEPPWR